MSDTNVHRVVGNLLVGTSHFFVDTTTNQVGINTSSPSASLDVATGDLKVGSGITIGNNGTITATNFSGNGSGLNGINSDSGSWVNGTNSNVHLAVSTDKVGIGTSSPGFKLHVKDSDSYSVVGRIESKEATISGTSSSAYVDVVDGSGHGGFIQGYHDPFVTHGLRLGTWTTSGRDSAAISILNNGNVGIGTSSPDEKLHVNGNIRLGGPQGTDEDASYYIKSAGQIHINSAADGTADDSYICLDLRAGQSGSNRSGIGICGAATSTTYQHIAFETTDTERMRINYDGNVGIGTSSPGAKLHIGAFDNNHLLLTSANNDYGWKMDTDDQGNGEVPFRIYRRTNTTDTLALSIANQNGRINHAHTEKFNFHWNPNVWSWATNAYAQNLNLWSFTLNVPYDGWIFIKCHAHWARYNSSNNAHIGGNESFYAWVSVASRSPDLSANYDSHTGASNSAYDRYHSYQSPDTGGAGYWRDLNHSGFYKVSAGNNTISLRVVNYFAGGHHLVINGGGVSGFYMPRNYL